MYQMGLELGLFLLQAASSATYVTAAATYTETTLAILLTLLTILALSIQIARGYFLRVLRKFTLRLAADIWWLLFIILRDASIFLVVFLGFMLFYPGVYEDFAIAVPFQLLAVNFYAAALVLLLVKDADEEPKYNTIITLLVAIGTLLYIGGTLFVTESATQLATLPATVSSSNSNIWGYMNNTFNSENNPTLAIYSFYVCFAILVIEGGIAFYYGLTGNLNMPKNLIRTKTSPITKQTVVPTNPAQQENM